MPDGENLDRWHTYEKRSADWAMQAAGYVRQFFDQKSKLFRVSVEEGDALDEKPNEPNAATSLIGLTMQRCDQKNWTLNGINWASLREQVSISKVALFSFPTANILPLRTFGVLPLFSTNYLAEWIPLCLGIGDLAGNQSYVISLRRVLCELFDLAGHNTLGPHRRSIHPFLLCNAMRALQALHDKMLESADDKAIEDLRSALQNDQALAAAVGPRSNKFDKNEFARAIKLRSQEFTDYLSKNSLSDILKHLLNFIELAAGNSLLTEIANLSRPNGRRADPSSLAYAMQTLAEANSKTHVAVLQQGLELLLKVTAQGSFSLGQPFHGDSKGRTLFVPSIEIANIAISIFLDHLGESSRDMMSDIIDKTTEIHDVLLDQCNTIEAKIGDTTVQLRGWCSDRAPSPCRIDSWITVQVMEFFLNRVNLLRWSKRAGVFSEYNVKLWTDCRPSWDKVQDPDEGHLQSTVKETIWRVVTSTPKQTAPVFLLYGPPGTSKTTFVNAIAAEKKWDLVSLSPSDFVADSLDRIELRSRKIFKDLMMVDKCVILMDEMDSLFRDRKAFERNPGTIIEYVIPALLPKLQDLREYALNHDIAIFYVTNYFEAVDSAISRGGRMDNRLLVLPYSKKARVRVAEDLHSEGKGTTIPLSLLLDVLSDMPCNHVYRDIESLVALLLSGAPRDRLIEAAESSGVDPGVYDPMRRIGAYREYCSFIARLTDQAVDKKPITTMAEALTFLRSCYNAIRPNIKFSAWSDNIRAWETELEKQPH